MIWIIAAILVLALVFGVLAARESTRTNRPGGAIKSKFPLTANEQAMYFRLVEALPDHVVLGQVAFSALLTTSARATRNTFDRKVADFVICEKSFRVVAIVELDDSSHKGKEIADSKRDALLQDAGYKVLRYKSVPDIRKVKSDFLRLAADESVSPA